MCTCNAMQLLLLISFEQDLSAEWGCRVMFQRSNSRLINSNQARSMSYILQMRRITREPHLSLTRT